MKKRFFFYLLPALVLCELPCVQAQTFFSETFQTGADPLCVVAADVNGDGKMDLISANIGKSTLTVLTNDGTANFVASGIYTAGTGVASVVAADVNDDGKMDLISANVDDSTLTVLTNDGSGNFAISGTYAVGARPVSVAAADVNDDGKMDLISANVDDSTLTVLTNDGRGNFDVSGTYAAGDNPQCVVAADVNGDGKADLVSANYSDGTLTVLTNDGRGNFAISGTYAVGNNPQCVVAADVNGDGKADLVSANYSDGTLTVLTNNGSGGFSTSGIYSVGYNPCSVAAADVNGDGKVDLISANSSANTLTVLTNNGSGGFIISGIYAVGNSPVSVVASDIDGDGKVALISANSVDSTLTVLAPLTTIVTSSVNPSALTQPVVFTAAVYPAAASGSMIVFYDGGTAFATNIFTGNTASVTNAALPLGPSRITALYSDANGSSMSLTFTQLVEVPLVWHGGVSTNWDIATTANWLFDNTAANYADDSPVQFDDTAVQTNVFITASVSPSSILVSNNALAYTISGGTIGGTGGLTKSGAGGLTLMGTNTFSGGTVINGGFLQVSGSSGSGTTLGTGNVTINAGASLVAEGTNAFGFGSTAPANIFINGGQITGLKNPRSPNPQNYRVTLPDLTFTGGVLSNNLPNKGDANGIYSLYGDGANAIITSRACTSTAIFGTSSNIYGNPGISLQSPVTFDIAQGNVTAGTTPDVDMIVPSALINFNKNPVSFTKTGAGILELNNSNSFTGTLTVNNGTLLFGPGSTSPLSTNVVIEDGAALIFNGVDFNMEKGQTLTGGQPMVMDTSYFVNTISGNVIFDPTSSLVLAYTNGVPTFFITDGKFDLNNNPVTVTVVGIPLPAGTYTLIATNDTTGLIAGVNGLVMRSSLTINGSATSGTNAMLQITNNQLNLVVSGVAAPPPLEVTQSGGQIILSWPTNNLGFNSVTSLFVIQTNSDLATANWRNYAATLTSSNTVNIIPTANQLFFRLVTYQTSGGVSGPSSGGWNLQKNNQ